jgi:hypothetical protein
MRPDKYGDSSKLAVTGADGGAIQTNATLQIKIVQPTEAEDGGDC